MSNKWWRVYLGAKEIDKVNNHPSDTARDVYNSLVNHDGYDSRIVVIAENNRHDRYPEARP